MIMATCGYQLIELQKAAAARREWCNKKEKNADEKIAKEINGPACTRTSAERVSKNIRTTNQPPAPSSAKDS